ncbi:MAG: hypothetical protein M5U29_07090 [Anaerolineae bacterium]|nr:hypothetical protein [Anaerolineae bacterium]
MQEFEHWGHWWFQSGPDEGILGRLKQTGNEGLRLELYPLYDSASILTPPTARTILGLTEKTEEVTLSECLLIGQKTSPTARFVKWVFTPLFAYFGGQFEDPEALRFHKAVIQYSHLPDWAMRRIQYGLPQEKGGTEKSREFEIAFSKPKPIEVEIDDGKFSINWLSPFSTGSAGEMNLHQVVQFEIQTEEDKPIQEWLSKYIYPLQDFLTLGTVRANSVSKLTLFSREHTHDQPDGKGVFEIPIEVVGISPVQDIQHRFLLPQDMLFTLQDIDEDFEVIVRRWLAVAQELVDIRAAFFEAAYLSGTLYLPNIFLNVVQALEGYHQQRFPGQHMLSRQERKALREEIRKLIPLEHWSSIQVRLSYIDAPMLRDRINGLLDKTSAIVSPPNKRWRGVCPSCGGDAQLPLSPGRR